MTAGRPKFEITKDVCKKAESLAAQGLTKEQIAQVLGISYQTLNEKTKEYSDFSEAIDAGKAKGIAQITNALYKKASEGDVPAQKYYLNNRDNRNWKDRIEQKTTHEGNINLTNLSDEELNAQLRQEEQKLKQSTQD